MASGFYSKVIGNTGELAVRAQLGKLGLVVMICAWSIGCANSNEAPKPVASTIKSEALAPRSNEAQDKSAPPASHASKNTGKASATQIKIYDVAKRLVRERLHKPGGAKFSDVNSEDTSVEKQEDGLWVVHAVVIAPNLEGKTLRTPFVFECRIESGKVKPSAIDIADGPGEFDVAKSPEGDPLAFHG